MRLTTCFTALTVSLLAAFALSAQQPNSERQEIAFTLGELSGSNPGATAGNLALGSGEALQANFAKKFHDLKWGFLYWEVNGLGSPSRGLSGTPATATHEIWSLYVTPGVKLQFTPLDERIQPWIVGGGGYALYGESSSSIAGGPAGVSGHTNRGAIEVGGGIDFALGKRYMLRGEARGFYTGGPNFGVNTPGGQFNLAISAGIVWRFPK